MKGKANIVCKIFDRILVNELFTSTGSNLYIDGQSGPNELIKKI